MAVTANAAYRIFAACKLRKVEMWSPAAAGGQATCSIAFYGNVYIGGENKIISDTTLGADRPAHICAVPPKDSMAHNWFNDGAADNIMLLSCPGNTIIDIDMELVIRNAEASFAVTGAVAAATVGKCYVRALDSTSGAGIIPVSLATI